MLANFSFVVPKRLAGSGHLGWGAQLESNARELADLHGITKVVSLTEDAVDSQALEAAGLSWLHAPIPDMCPPSPGEAVRVVKEIGEEIEAGGRVVVHCLGGYGRTGTILACCLVSRGTPARDAVRTIRRLRPGSIETPEQERFVTDFEQVWADRGETL